jgi:His/Glu/Gln/Arg/opine family amino acid ABC transporter permease subunit
MSWYVLGEYWDVLLGGLLTTLRLSAASWLIAIAVGIAVAQLRFARAAPLRALGAAYVEFFRNVPPIVIIFFFYFALPSIEIHLSAFAAVAVGVGLYGGAMMAEIIRSGIAAVPRGQFECATAYGMSYLQAMRLVILPQALRTVIPPMGTETINVIKNTSLGAAVSAGEILSAANLVGSQTFAYAVSFVAAAALYLLLTFPAAAATNALERAMARR